MVLFLMSYKFVHLQTAFCLHNGIMSCCMSFTERLFRKNSEATVKNEMKLSRCLMLSLAVVTTTLGEYRIARSYKTISADQSKFNHGSTVFFVYIRQYRQWNVKQSLVEIYLTSCYYIAFYITSWQFCLRSLPKAAQYAPRCSSNSYFSYYLLH